MNIICKEILIYLKENNYSNQRRLSEELNFSLGLINKNFNFLKKEGYINKCNILTKKSFELLEKNKVEKAIIFADDFNKRIVSENNEVSIGLLKIDDEILIERIIKQLNDKKIFDIYIVVGYMKESYEYLIDQYNVKLLHNKQYKNKNNLFSIFKAFEYLENAYILPCNIYCKNNPFKEYEMSSILFFQKNKKESKYKLNKDFTVLKNNKNNFFNEYSGIGFFHRDDFERLKDNIFCLIKEKDNFKFKYEDAIFLKNNFKINYRMFENDNFFIIDNQEGLGYLYEKCSDLKGSLINLISKVCKVKESDIENVELLKKGMTNNSFVFEIQKQKYIIRTPGSGSNILINRKYEYEIYQKIIPLKISEEVLYINKENGYKISKFIECARVCDPNDIDDVKSVMNFLRKFHNMNIKVKNKFDLLETLNLYESLRGIKSLYKDYNLTKKKILKLILFIKQFKKEYCLCHIDAICDNFLFDENKIYLIDWEYAGMQDPHLDIAMFCIYALYDRKKIDEVIDIYFDGMCNEQIKDKIYAYIAICGLIWSNWCEYKIKLGNDFSDYSLKQYRYSKEYFKILNEKYNFMEMKNE